jgi:hypothetical protein
LAEATDPLDFVQQQWLTSFAKGDAAGLAMLYTMEGQLMPAYSAAICGRPAIQAFWQGCFDMGIGAMLREPSTIDTLTHTANEIGAYCFLDRRNRLLDVGKYVTIWQWRQGVWQIHCDMWTSNLPGTC